MISSMTSVSGCVRPRSQRVPGKVTSTRSSISARSRAVCLTAQEQCYLPFTAQDFDTKVFDFRLGAALLNALRYVAT